MKAVVVLLTILAAFWLIRRGMQPRKDVPRPSKRTVKTLPMVGCQHCGVHIPGNEVVTGRTGSYCSTAHQQAHEGKAAP